MDGGVRRRASRALIVLSLAAGALAAGAGTAVAAGASGGGFVGAVYAETNATAGNEVLIFDRRSDGSLTAAGSVSTGGLGTGAGLGDQGAVTLSPSGRWLLAVNAGSDSVSAFRVAPGGGLTFANVVPSGGTGPVSVTASSTGLVYVVNGGSDDISGFTLGSQGLSPIAGSTLPLSGTGVGPAQISFVPGLSTLAVTEKATNLIDTYVVGPGGLASGPFTHASSGATPFGFAAANRHLIVSEAFGGTAGASAVSSYGVRTGGRLTTLSASVPDTQTAACWVVTTRNGFAYTTNTGSNTISSYAISPGGDLPPLP